MTERRLVFISHANPEDNEFASWLGTKLTAAGYEVWTDMLKLLGGRDVLAGYWHGDQGGSRCRYRCFISYVLSERWRP